MIASLSDAQDLLRPYEPRVSAEQIVEALNRWYHEREVHTYDRQHVEIRQQLPPLWDEMIQIAQGAARGAPWRILNFGCGTGFEASELLRRQDRGAIAELWCYDLSPEMLERCRARILPVFPRARFTSRWQDVSDSDARFNLLATNSVLHHLPQPLRTVASLGELLTSDALWLQGHEPSSRFYRNAECCRVYGQFLRGYRQRRWFSPAAYLRFAQRQAGLSRSPAEVAAAAAVASGMLGRRPPSRVVSRLVDLHVAHSDQEARSGRGFDVEQMARHFAGQWRLCWSKSYSFMGSFYEGRLSARWQAIGQRLARAFPTDGANFCAVWQRIGPDPAP
jgi:SAM-dependent methyltransferase